MRSQQEAERPPSPEFHPATAERWTDLEQLFGPRGAYGGCWCMWWRLTRKEFSARSAAERKDALKALAESDRPPGIVAYVDGVPAGWCSIGPRESYPALDRSRTLRRVDDEPVWSIVCFFIARPFRRKGLMVGLLEAAIEYAREQGARIVEGYPIEPEDNRLSGASGYMGLVSAFREVGFVEVFRATDRQRIMRYSLQDG